MIIPFAALSSALSGYFRSDAAAADAPRPFEISLGAGDKKKTVLELMEEERIRIEEALLGEGKIAAPEERPPTIVLSLAERVDALLAAMDRAGTTAYAPQNMPTNWTTSMYTDMQHGGGGRFVGYLYTDQSGRDRAMVTPENKIVML